jgi:hypothetical protein
MFVIGVEATLCLIERGTARNGSGRTTHLLKRSLQPLSARLDLALALMHLLPVMALAREHAASRLNETSHRSFGSNHVYEEVVRESGSVHVFKVSAFRSFDAAAAFFSRMRLVRALLVPVQLPRRWCAWIDCRLDEGKREVTSCFAPKCSRAAISGLESVMSAVGDVARGLVELHSRGVVHNDVRWPNVVQTYDLHQRAEAGGWARFLLIDFDDACVLDADGLVPACPDLSTTSHAPTIAARHGPEVDVWGLGQLLLAHRHVLREDVRTFADAVVAGSYRQTTAAQFLAELERL